MSRGKSAGNRLYVNIEEKLNFTKNWHFSNIRQFRYERDLSVEILVKQPWIRQPNRKPMQYSPYLMFPLNSKVSCTDSECATTQSHLSKPYGSSGFPTWHPLVVWDDISGVATKRESMILLYWIFIVHKFSNCPIYSCILCTELNAYFLVQFVDLPYCTSVDYMVQSMV